MTSGSRRMARLGRRLTAIWSVAAARRACTGDDAGAVAGGLGAALPGLRHSRWAGSVDRAAGPGVGFRRGLPAPPGHPDRDPPRRWVVEVGHSWFNRFRRLLIRWDKQAVHYLAFA